MELNELIVSINYVLWGWPMVIFVLGASLSVTVALRFVQFRYFKRAWELLFKSEAGTQGDLSPFQAFVNALSTGIGNGSIAGIATAVHAGGPGAAFWVFVFGLLSMALRYAEVFLGTYFPPVLTSGNLVGGPMVYLTKIPYGHYMAYLYGIFLFMFSLGGGSGIQANSITLGVVRIFNVSPWIVATVLLLFIAYVMAGGAQRIIKVSDKIVPLKVGVFFISAIIVLVYHYQSIGHALTLIIEGAFYPRAFAAGSMGFLIQQAMRYGISRSVNASEAGLGTSAVLFGGTGSKEPVKNGIMSMISVFISANLVCFMVALMIIASGVWNNGQTSLNLTISAYETVFGMYGGWVVTFLSASFGLGVLVAYAYIARVCWFFLTKGRFELLYRILFCIVTFLGSIAQVEVVWNSMDVINGVLLIINLIGILWLLPLMRKKFIEKEHSI